MITIICGTNRPDNQSRKFVKTYQQLVIDKGYACEVIELENLPHNFAFANEIYGIHNEELEQVLNTKFIPASKLVVISPEYNGSFPGILKAFIDAIHPKHFKNKTVALVGISSGRAGNLRGMDHLTGIFHYLGAHVLSLKIDIANISGLNEDHSHASNDPWRKRLENQIDLLAN